MSKSEIELQDEINFLEKCNSTQGKKIKELKSKLFNQNRTIEALLSQVKAYIKIVKVRNKELTALRDTHK